MDDYWENRVKKISHTDSTHMFPEIRFLEIKNNLKFPP